MPRGRPRYSSKVKFQAVLELVCGKKTLAQLSKAYSIHPNSLLLWKRTFMERGNEVFEERGGSTSLERRIAELEQLIGKKEVEIALLKNFLGRQQ
jgi:transposase-like protein